MRRKGGKVRVGMGGKERKERKGREWVMLNP